MTVRIIQGNCCEVLKTLPDASVNCCVTSPPYWGLRCYGTEPQIWGGKSDCQHQFDDQKIPDLTGGVESISGNVAFKYYGGRGITVCDRWADSYETFLADMGPKPTPKHTIDRINSDGNYEPGNCRWATMAEQNHNQRKKERHAPVE